MKSIRFLDKELKENLCRVPQLREFIESNEKKSEMKGENLDSAGSPFFSFSQPTNLGIFRFYAETYLKQHPDVDTSQTIILRHKPFEGNGLPLQLYLFTKKNQFVPYENMQSEIDKKLLDGSSVRFVGTATIGYTITDGIGGTNSSIITVTVLALADIAVNKTGPANVNAAASQGSRRSSPIRT